MGEIKKETLAFEMAKQLHEQYAINDNAKAGNVIGFIAAIAFVFTGFGYIYIQPYLNTDKNYPQLFVSAYVLANMVLSLLAVLSVIFGYSTRRDHIVISKIREKEGVEWFKNGRKKEWYNYLPNYYSIIFLFVMLAQILIFVGALMNIGMEKESKCYVCIFFIILVVINLFFYYKYYQEYKKVKN